MEFDTVNRIYFLDSSEQEVVGSEGMVFPAEDVDALQELIDAAQERLNALDPRNVYPAGSSLQAALNEQRRIQGLLSGMRVVLGREGPGIAEQAEEFLRNLK